MFSYFFSPENEKCKSKWKSKIQRIEEHVRMKKQRISHKGIKVCVMHCEIVPVCMYCKRFIGVRKTWMLHSVTLIAIKARTPPLQIFCLLATLKDRSKNGDISPFPEKVTNLGK